ncbi:MAG: WYL domain-containing protein [Agathobacter sp.]|nr:WYL domain-containing protein [Agathobacter sp.]
MAKSPKQKQKLLYVAKFFLEHTDENHPAQTPRILEYLEKNDIKAERKSIYDDIATLCDFGYDIVKNPGPRGGYFLAGRDFELAEVKLLVDLVQSSKFITTKKSRELIKKLASEVSFNDAKSLQRQVVVAERNKAANENIYYSVDVIYEAIAQNKKIRYHYFEWDLNKEIKLRKNGEYYEVSPWLLTWADENYYLVAYDENAEIIKHYRVDKMLHIELVDEERSGREVFERIDVAAMSKKTFGMFAGNERTVQLLCDKALTGVIIDRFGKEVAIRKYDENNILARSNIEISPQFFGWLSGFGDKMSIHGPEDVRNDYINYINTILSQYSAARTLEHS